MKKKVLSVVLMMAMGLSLTACGSQNEKDDTASSNAAVEKTNSKLCMQRGTAK